MATYVGKTDNEHINHAIEIWMDKVTDGATYEEINDMVKTFESWAKDAFAKGDDYAMLNYNYIAMGGYVVLGWLRDGISCYIATN